MRYKPRIGAPGPWGSDHRPRRRAHDTHGGAVSRDHGCCTSVGVAAEALGCGCGAPDVAVRDGVGTGGGDAHVNYVGVARGRDGVGRRGGGGGGGGGDEVEIG